MHQLTLTFLSPILRGVMMEEDEEEAKRARRKARDNNQRGSELKPSEILAQAQARDHSDDASSSSSSESSDDDEDDDGDGDGDGDKDDGQPIFEKREKVVFADGEYEDSVSPYFLLFHDTYVIMS
jgi:hypothetical protein